MGLDMYMYGVPSRVIFKKVEELTQYLQDENECSFDFEGLGINNSAYWHDAFCIRAWIFKHCEPVVERILYKVSKENLLQLIKDCTDSLLDQKKAQELLPLSDPYNNPNSSKWYRHHLKHTIRNLGEFIEDLDEDYSFYFIVR